MGQPITVTARSGAAVRLDVRPEPLAHRDGHRALPSVDDAQAAGHARPTCWPSACSKPGADHVTVYSNTVTVEAPAERWAELEPKAIFLIEHLFEYYGDDAGWSYEARGVEPPPPIDPPD